MGQYYKAVFLTEKNKPTGYVYSHEFGSGLKLMEHSWIKNPFVQFVERQLINKPMKLVWAGDYAPNEDPKTLSDYELKQLADEKNERWKFETLKEKGVNIYALSRLVGRLTHDEDVKDIYEHKFQQLESKFKYLVNHTKKEFVDKSKVPNVDGWRAHPLPLLTCEGNEEGNGDYYSEDGKEFIGVWSRDLISVESIKPKGYTEIKPDFKE
jgi:hypothetical protein